jgi:hypothetical protein
MKMKRKRGRVKRSRKRVSKLTTETIEWYPQNADAYGNRGNSKFRLEEIKVEPWLILIR